MDSLCTHFDVNPEWLRMLIVSSPARTGFLVLIAWPKTTVIVSNQIMFFFSRLYFDRMFIHEHLADSSMEVLHSADPGSIR